MSDLLIPGSGFFVGFAALLVGRKGFGRFAWQGSLFLGAENKKIPSTPGRYHTLRGGRYRNATSIIAAGPRRGYTHQ